MRYIYRHLISQNLAPPGAQRIVACNAAGEQVCTISLGPLTPPAAQPLYSVGLASDIHLYPVAAVVWKPEKKFRAALGHWESEGCKMVVVSGDLSQTGFYRERTLEDGTTEKYYDPVQMQEYKTIREEFGIPVWGLLGNHESYCRNVTDTPDDVEEVMGIRALSYTISDDEPTERNVQVTGLGNDMFILCGQPSPGFVMSDEDFQWLTETLAANAHRRCFLFVHSYIEEDAGDPADVRENSIFELWGTTRKNEFMTLLRRYPNVVLFHGHSHMKFYNQEHDPAANYTERNGFKSVHIPSLATPRDIDFDNNKSVDDPNASEGYIVDVYPDGIHLRGWDFIANAPVPLGTLWVDIPGEPSYTNLLPLAINADGIPYVGTNGEKGYKVGWRINSSNVEKESSANCVTGFIPVTSGATVRVKNAIVSSGRNGYFHWYNSKFEMACSAYYEDYNCDRYSTKPNSGGLIEFNAPTGVSDLKYFRMTTGVISADTIITVNEVIV